MTIRYRVDISAQFEHDVNHSTGWVHRVSEWVKGRNIEYESDVEGLAQHILYFTDPEEAMMFILLFGGV